MKTQQITRKLRKGFTLTETIIALGTVGVALPISLAAMVAAGKTGSGSNAETTATIAARSIQAKPEEFFSGADSTGHLSLSADGAVLGQIGQFQFDQGVTDGGVYMLAEVMKEEMPSASAVGSLQMERVTVKVTHPAAAPLEKRRVYTFYQNRSK